MQDVLIIFCILLVLLMLLSTFGGTIRPSTENFKPAKLASTAPAVWQKEAFETDNAPATVLTAPANSPSLPVILPPSQDQSQIQSQAPPASFQDEMNYASIIGGVSVAAEEAPLSSSFMPIEAFQSYQSKAPRPQAPAHYVEAFDGNSHFASIMH